MLIINNYLKNPNLYLLLFINLMIALIMCNNFLPQEDAAILFRYSENLSETGVISYNFLGEKTEGATDFLWMIILSIFHKIGFDTYFISIFLNLSALTFSAVVVKDQYNLKNNFIYIFFFVYFLFSFTWSSLFGFSVLFFQLVLFLNIIFFLKRKIFLFLLLNFIGILVRPDYLLFIIVFNIIIILENLNKKIFYYYLSFTLVGILFFIWRANYFDMFMPLPYYVKSQWNFLNNLEWGKQLIICLPGMFLFYVCEFKEIFKKQNLYIILSIIILPTLYYANQILYQNIGQRFYFYFMTGFVIILFNSKLKKNINYKFKYYVLIATGLVSLIINIQFKEIFPFDFEYYTNKDHYIKLTKQSAVYKFSNDLKKVNRNLNIATTEAGIIPFYSKANTIDLFGLNTKKFAKNPAGGKYINNNHFDILIIHTGQYGTDCNSIKKLFNETKNLNKKNVIDRNSTWTKFTFQLFSGINKDLYKAFILPIYKKNNHVFVFINRIGNNFETLNSVAKKNAIECKF